MRNRSSWLLVTCALALAVGSNGCTTCGTNPEGAAAGESMGQAAEEEVMDDARRDSSY